MSTRNIVKNIRSAEVIQGKPKLPTSNQLDYGEIAVNYAKGHETLSLKNDAGNIVSLSIKTVDDVTVNGNSVVSNKTANIIMKGNTTPVADTYSTTTFPSPFESKAEHISASDKVNVALKKVETNISKLVSEVVDNENVVSEAISKLANSAGTIDGSNNITYVKATNAHYISDATSVHDATVKLDSNVFSIKKAVDDIGNAVDGINSHVTIIATDVDTLKNQVTNLKSFCDTNFHQVFGQIGDLQDQINSLRGIIRFVDLDLPSGTLWAKCNIGAETETDYGDYFMWGSTTPNTNTICDWSTAPFNGGNSEYNAEAFNKVKDTVCPNGILAKGYDVAYKTTNGAARMPTEAEFQELLDNTSKEWIRVNSVNGWKFTSKTDTSKYIFIPASGNRSGSSFNNQGSYSSVWCSSLDSSDTSIAWSLDFIADNVSTNKSNRNLGLAVRAVRNLPL